MHGICARGVHVTKHVHMIEHKSDDNLIPQSE